MWAEHDLNDVATPRGFARDPDLVHGFYNARRAGCLRARPNAAHAALARLAGSGTVDLTLVTQNIDDLHERAGQGQVIHMHGQLLRGLCAACGARWDAPAVMAAADPCPVCQASATRPDVVWFGEMPYHMERILGALARSELFVAIGTSGEVYPAAGFADAARQAGARTLELNLEATGGRFDAVRAGPATEVVPAWVDAVMGGAPAGGASAG